jgi:hypothetical protein
VLRNAKKIIKKWNRPAYTKNNFRFVPVARPILWLSSELWVAAQRAMPSWARCQAGREAV